MIVSPSLRAFLAAQLVLTSCARNWVNYPPRVAIDSQGRSHVIAARAMEFNGSDLDGKTVIDITQNGVHIAVADGINNSRSTEAGYRTARYGAGAIAIVSGLGIVSHAAQVAYGSNQAANTTSNVAASKASASIAASKGATTVELAKIQAAKEAAAAAAAANAAKVLPAAGSTIPATVPATVVPVP